MRGTTQREALGLAHEIWTHNVLPFASIIFGTYKDTTSFAPSHRPAASHVRTSGNLGRGGPPDGTVGGGANRAAETTTA